MHRINFSFSFMREMYKAAGNYISKKLTNAYINAKRAPIYLHLPVRSHGHNISLHASVSHACMIYVAVLVLLQLCIVWCHSSILVSSFHICGEEKDVGVHNKMYKSTNTISQVRANIMWYCYSIGFKMKNKICSKTVIYLFMPFVTGTILRPIFQVALSLTYL